VTKGAGKRKEFTGEPVVKKRKVGASASDGHLLRNNTRKRPLAFSESREKGPPLTIEEEIDRSVPGGVKPFGGEKEELPDKVKRPTAF